MTFARFPRSASASFAFNAAAYITAVISVIAIRGRTSNVAGIALIAERMIEEPRIGKVNA
jgi:hypothetical protein